LYLEWLEPRRLPSLTITDLGTLGGPSSIGYAVNANGIVVGAADTDSNGDANAFLYATAMHNLGTLSNGTTSAARAVNDNPNPDVAGDSDTVVNNVHYDHAFRKLSGASMTDLHTLIPLPHQDEGTSSGTGINAAGDVGGRSNITYGMTNTYNAFWFKSSDGSLNGLAGYNGEVSYANAIENSSTPVLVGASKGYPDTSCPTPLPNYNHAYSWSGTTQLEIGALSGGEEAHAFAETAGAALVTGDGAVGHSCMAMPTPTPSWQF
jgi:probable HAF family extracellular repeat protein